MPEKIQQSEIELLTRLQESGELEAFTELVEPLRLQLFAFIYRMVANRETAEDLHQEVLLRAFQNIRMFRREASFKTWLFSIATNICLDHLRQKKRWRVEGQVIGERDTEENNEGLKRLEAIISKPDFTYEVREHIAFCFSCIGRTLAPEEQAAILLREICGFSNEESAAAMEISEPIFRHRLSAARKRMTEIYQGMCALINKKGVCNQCQSLREFTPENNRGASLVQITVRRGVSITPENLFAERLKIVREANLENGGSSTLHTFFFDGMTKQEESAAH